MPVEPEKVKPRYTFDWRPYVSTDPEFDKRVLAETTLEEKIPVIYFNPDSPYADPEYAYLPGRAITRKDVEEAAQFAKTRRGIAKTLDLMLHELAHAEQLENLGRAPLTGAEAKELEAGADVMTEHQLDYDYLMKRGEIVAREEEKRMRGYRGQYKTKK